jgi:hypothetical protein
VGIDQAGQHRVPLETVVVLRPIAAQRGVGGQHIQDAAVPDGNGVVVQDTVVRPDRYDPAGMYQQIDVTHRDNSRRA